MLRNLRGSATKFMLRLEGSAEDLVAQPPTLQFVGPSAMKIQAVKLQIPQEPHELRTKFRLGGTSRGLYSFLGGT